MAGAAGSEPGCVRWLDVSDGSADQPSPEDRPRIVRRDDDDGQLSEPLTTHSESEPQTKIIRRHPTGEFPRVLEEPQTSFIGDVEEEAQTTYVPRARPLSIPRTSSGTTPRTAVAAAVMSILSGWATAVIATDLITGWWRTDRLFCVAIGFLTAVSAAATIGGLILLLLRRRMGRLLIVVGSVIGLLIFSSLFIAGAQLHPIVYAIPVLPAAGIVLTVLPSTGRWARRP